MSETTTWRGEICKRCDRRNCIGFSVPDEVWSAVVRGRWGVLCTSCFDEEAEAAGIAYRFGEVWPITWSMWEEGE